jgi:division protein 1
MSQGRQIEAFSRKVTATASHLIGPLEGSGTISHHYQNALGEIHREMRRPIVQRSMFSFAQNSPKELIRNVKTSEIQHRTLAYLPDELLRNIPEPHSTYSLFQGFQASWPDEEVPLLRKRLKGREEPRGRRLLTDAERAAQAEEEDGPPELVELKNEKFSLRHRLEMLGVRKNMCSSEIREIDTKISNLNTMRRIVLERLANLEQEEVDLEQELLGVDNKLEDLQEELEDAAALASKSPETNPSTRDDSIGGGSEFMSESIYEKLPSPRTRRRMRANRRISMPILHEHMEPGSRIREVQAHNDMITALDFDYPYGTLVTAALDDTVRVWDLHAGRCMGMLEGHLSSVRCLQVEDEIVATGSMDATIRLWDLSRAQYAPKDTNNIHREDHDEAEEDEDDALGFQNEGDEPPAPPSNSMADCPLFALQAHVAEVTALHFRGNTLVSGSADKTLRQWDLQKGRCVQTLDVLWAAAQASATQGLHDGQWRGAAGGGRLPDPDADFVGALQCFDAALACGTADGMVRLWDLRSGQVHRSLVGHTGPISSLQFDDVHLVTGSLDRSIRVSLWSPFDPLGP